MTLLPDGGTCNERNGIVRIYGISSWIVNSLSAEESIEKLANSGFKYIEISGSGSGLLKEWEDDPVGVCQRLKAVDIRVLSIHCPVAGRSLDHADESARRSSVEANLAYFAKMKDCGIREIVIHLIGAGDYSTPEKYAESRARSDESLRTLARYAGQIGVRMAVENLGSNRPGSSMTDLLEMIDGLGDHVGICFDVGHAEQAGLDLTHELKTAISAEKIFSLHIHDVNAAGRDHFIPEEGRIDWNAFISELDAYGFREGRILEISPPETNFAERLRKSAALKDEWERR